MRRVSGSEFDPKASEWNLIADQVKRAGIQSDASDLRTWYVEGFGRNLSGEQLAIGVPVLLGAWTQENSGSFTSNKPKGFHNVYHAFVPNTVSEANAMVGRLNRIAVTLEVIPNNGVGRIAIAGIVGAKVSGSGEFAKPLPKSDANHKTRLGVGSWGVRILGTSSDQTFSILDLSTYQFNASYSLTQNRQAPPSGTNATVDGTSSLFVVDSNSCATWQLNGDSGIATLQNNRFVITVPWCANA